MLQNFGYNRCHKKPFVRFGLTVRSVVRFTWIGRGKKRSHRRRGIGVGDSLYPSRNGRLFPSFSILVIFEHLYKLKYRHLISPILTPDILVCVVSSLPPRRWMTDKLDPFNEIIRLVIKRVDILFILTRIEHIYKPFTLLGPFTESYDSVYHSWVIYYRYNDKCTHNR